ncbi:MAG: DJ-1/PfpI family protein [Candidatus Micrarchaeales archaeon]
MKFLVFIAPNNFKDETVSMIKNFFNKWGVEYQITSYSNKDCVGYHGVVIKPDVNAGKVSASDYDGIILVDGNGMEEYKLFEYRPLLDTVMLFNEKGKLIVAINNSIKVTARANIIKDKKIATPELDELKRLVLLFHGIPSENGMEISGNIVTIKESRGLEVPLQEMLQHIGVM